MKQETRDLLLEIAKCPNIDECYKEASCVCNEIVKTQVRDKEKFAVPEPWNGDLENAKILFVSSNPSFNESENYPEMNWNDEEIIEFFDGRFSGKYTNIRKDNKVCVKNVDGTSGKAEPFWGAIRKRTAELLYDGREKEVKHGKDYCLTEVVHCKSKNEKGLDSTVISECYNKYFNKLVKLSDCKVVVVLGHKAFRALAASGIKISEELLGKEDKKIYCEEIELEHGVRKLFTYLDHPAAGEPLKSFTKFPKEELDKIKNVLL